MMMKKKCWLRIIDVIFNNTKSLSNVEWWSKKIKYNDEVSCFK